MKRIAILGSTGSIGTQTLEVCRQHPKKLQVVALAAHSNGKALLHQAKEFGVKHFALFNQEIASHEKIPGGLSAIKELAVLNEVDMVVIAMAGVIALEPTLAAIQAGKDIALASKEVLVAAGEIIMPMIRQHQVNLTPIDSEHSALLQCMQGYAIDQVEKFIITASGGAFRGLKKEEVALMDASDALKHPTWNMGSKITIDCATLMNKGLELIEAKWLFDARVDQLDLVVHPQSIIHSFVKFLDGSVLAQLGWPDMRLPIQYALLYPLRTQNQMKSWSPLDTPELTFESLDNKTFKGPKIALESLRIGGTMPCVMNAANEYAVEAFLRSEVKFLEIFAIIEEVMSKCKVLPSTLANILDADRWAREEAKKCKVKLAC